MNKKERLEKIRRLVTDYQIGTGHGNIEFLAYLKKEKSASNQIFAEIKEAVERAHSQFKNE
ncbi:hemolysin A [Streptococcus pneumoniae]|nr:hemolysin A [Streptococcus pneumoniae]